MVKMDRKKIVTWKPALRVVNICAVIAFLLLLLPLLCLAAYAVPWYDDFNYGSFAKAAMAAEPGIGGALKGAWECAKVQWFAWQGTFSSAFFMAITPVIWGESRYFLGPVFLILLLAVSVFVLTGALTGNVLHVDAGTSLSPQIISVIMVIELIYTAQQGFYWYNGGVHYVGMHSFCMLFIAVLVKLWGQKPIKSIKGILLTALSMSGALLAGGSNYVTALQGLIVLCIIGGLAFVTEKKRILRYLPAAVVYAFAFYKNVSAPGNQVRAASYEGWGYSPMQAVLRSFSEAFRHSWLFTGWITVAFLILLLPLIWHMVGKSSFAFRFPGLVLAGSFCLYAAGFTPSLYSMGHAGLSRTLNAVKITWQILLLINEVYWLGWFKGILERRGKYAPKNGIAVWWFYVLVGAAMLVIFRRSPNQAGCYSSYGAYYYLHRKEAVRFYAEYRERLELLHSDEKDIVFAPYQCRPWFLCMGDLDENPDAEENQSVAAWYDKDSVVVKNTENENMRQ
ncbi:MAG: hypothetical protein NC345_05075 [Lachnospira sp.]|nr:hypothetical protein [Lachnospira sp.]MCM1534321.1 hypothetical protein [Clostridium sp.]